ncbi:interferon-induced, double-stranded RNA-activated protein kinase isoform X6 [Xenopus laevis]|uniref:non-specific serine/threonine protein kinase n=1 Tax=Xenopus laevis TaxID=8355 RepID=A0A8J1KMS8_XENLA|nr:interferon-induced, double-stranded RNA-activated protein kinase isoform X6 [Xenopus laevis]
MFCAKRNINYEFRDISKKGPPHDPWFTVQLYIENEMFGEGQGKSKRAADMEAARTGLTALQNRKRSSSHTTQSKTNVAQSPLSEFEDITELSAGGYGKVFKAWKTMDLKYYAVKKVKMRNEKCKSEVQALARLDHPNIVRYFHSWTGTNFSLDSRSNIDSDRDCTTEDYSSDARSCTSSCSSRNIDSDRDGTTEDYSSDASSCTSSSCSSNTESDRDCTTEDYSSDARSCTSSSSSNKAQRNEYLYIQMEFCENGDLRDWIINMKTVDKKKSLDIFRHIVEGVIYIHSENLIHRDLKPENIFFAKDMRVKIGDLGLVTQMSNEDSTEALIRTHRTGTPSYRAPEQRKNIYNNEVDIFALGLILVELLYKFTTGHERVIEMKKLRKGQFPVTFVAQYPYETHTVKKMLSTDPTKRPTAKQLKQFLETKNYLDSRTC